MIIKEAINFRGIYMSRMSRNGPAAYRAAGKKRRVGAEHLTYEAWMNDMATKDDKPARGWQAKYQPRCDRCGKFVLPGAEGGSWVMVPATDWNAGDERERCATCTAKHGMAHCGPGYVEHLCCGMNKPSNTG